MAFNEVPRGLGRQTEASEDCLLFRQFFLYHSGSINFGWVPSRPPWLQGHSAIHGQRISATKATTQDVSSVECAMDGVGIRPTAGA